MSFNDKGHIILYHHDMVWLINNYLNLYSNVKHHLKKLQFIIVRRGGVFDKNAKCKKFKPRLFGKLIIGRQTEYVYWGDNKR